MAWCLWETVGKTESEEEAVGEDVMDDCSWLEGREKEVAREHLIPALRKGWEVMQGREYMLLTDLVTEPRYQHMGAAGMLVQWGAEEARRKGLPAYCEASEMIEGPVYEDGL